MDEKLSNNGLTVERLDNSQWQEFKDIRLKALKTDPQAFSSTYVRESAYEDEKWQQRLETANQGKTSWMYFAKVNGKAVGMIGGFRSGEDVKNHSAQIWGVYVEPEFRGKGISKKLMSVIIDQLSKDPDIKVLKLEVNTDQQTAKRLYESFGFKETKTSILQLGDGLEHQITEMEKILES